MMQCHRIDLHLATSAPTWATPVLPIKRLTCGQESVCSEGDRLLGFLQGLETVVTHTAQLLQSGAKGPSHLTVSLKPRAQAAWWP